MSGLPDPKNPGYDTAGNPLITGTVGGVIQPVVFKDPKQGYATAKGEALDANGNPIDQTAALAELGLK